MRFSLLYFPIIFGIIFGFSAIRQAEAKPEEEKLTLKFETPNNITFDSIYLVSRYGERLFVLNLTGSVTNWNNGKPIQYKADVFMLNDSTWIGMVDSKQYLSINAKSGITEYLLDGEYEYLEPKRP